MFALKLSLLLVLTISVDAMRGMKLIAKAHYSDNPSLSHVPPRTRPVQTTGISTSQSARTPGIMTMTTLARAWMPVIAKSKAILVGNFHSRVIGDGFQMEGVSMNVMVLPILGGLVVVLRIIMICSSILRSMNKLIDSSPTPSQASGEEATEQIDVKTVDALPVHTIFDCFMMEHQEENTPVRLQGRVVARSRSITSPFAGGDCVFISITARQDGLKAPIEICRKGLEFELELTSRARVLIRGDQVSLFHMIGGKAFWEEALEVAKERIEKVGTMSQAEKSAQHKEADNWRRQVSGSAVFQFMESGLSIGAVVTCVGKLRRTGNENWELLPCSIGGEAQDETVWVSDNPTFVNADVTLAHSEVDFP